MSNNQKYTISLVLFSIMTSVLLSLILGSFMVSQGITNTMTQTVTINEIPEYRIDINECTKQELLTLPGIGETLADRIIDHRPYSDPWELLDIPGIGGTTFQHILEKVEV